MVIVNSFPAEKLHTKEGRHLNVKWPKHDHNNHDVPGVRILTTCCKIHNSKFKTDRTILKVCIHAAGDRFYIQIPTKTPMDLHVRMNLTSTTLGQFSFVWQSRPKPPVNTATGITNMNTRVNLSYVTLYYIQPLTSLIIAWRPSPNSKPTFSFACNPPKHTLVSLSGGCLYIYQPYGSCYAGQSQVYISRAANDLHFWLGGQLIVLPSSWFVWRIYFGKIWFESYTALTQFSCQSPVLC